MNLRRGLVWFHTVVQVSFGVVGFVVAPGELFRDVPTDALAGLCLRLAAYTNVALATLVIGVMVRFRDTATARLVCAALASYHALAAIDGLRVALGWLPVVMAEGRPSPVFMHAGFAVALAAAAAFPDRGGAPGGAQSG